ncbi:MAG: hypothetical protein LUD38_07555 [Parabacteroides sp.]|nr:hypothetical protein [Parabacteroides sp.]
MAGFAPRLTQQHKDNILDVQKNLSAARYYEKNEGQQTAAEVRDNPKNHDYGDCKAIPLKETCDNIGDIAKSEE